MLDAGCLVRGVGCWVQGVGCLMLDVGLKPDLPRFLHRAKARGYSFMLDICCDII